DLGCYGNTEIRTPHLDRLARQGLRLTDCYSASPVCSPSRAGLLTGRTPNRLGIYDWIPEKSGIYLRPEEITIAHLLRKAGYRTCHVGKWHLNSRMDGGEPTPGDAGFEHWLATQNNAHPSHLNPDNFLRNGTPVGRLEGASAHLLVDEAVRWLDTVREEPFFLNVWFHEPHEPVEAEERYLALYADEANADRGHYYADVTQMDAAVGRLLDCLDEHGLGRTTFVFFSSDNGPETLRRYPSANRSHGSPGPLRGRKLHMTEGGYRVPGIIRWPGRVPPGSESAEPVCSLDLLPTFCAMAGVEPPGDRALDGASLLPLLEGRTIPRTQPLYWQYDFAISNSWKISLRDGPWKLLANGALDTWRLYKIDDDPSELHDRSEKEHTATNRLEEALKRLHEEIRAEGARSGNPPPHRRENRRSRPQRRGNECFSAVAAGYGRAGWRSCFISPTTSLYSG
ncbi:MAG: sulfatase-like hydrolase/transferase, partial [Bdellovibrionaceae bacterium]|nr:sulfatase-like hydrolase/transferase [Pseudobdellovibrionaceae bacterium]